MVSGVRLSDGSPNRESTASAVFSLFGDPSTEPNSSSCDETKPICISKQAARPFGAERRKNSTLRWVTTNNLNRIIRFRLFFFLSQSVFQMVIVSRIFFRLSSYEFWICAGKASAPLGADWSVEINADYQKRGRKSKKKYAIKNIILSLSERDYYAAIAVFPSFY